MRKLGSKPGTGDTIKSLFILPQCCFPQCGLEYAAVAGDSHANVRQHCGDLDPMFRATIAFAALLIGCALPTGQALAQYYPSDVYRGPPLPAPDDDPAYDAPGNYRAPPAPGRPAPGRDQGSYDQRPYPSDPYGRSASPPYADADPNGTLRPPAGIYPDDRPPTYANPPGYPGGNGPAANTREPYTPGYGRQDDPSYPPRAYPGQRPAYGM